MPPDPDPGPSGRGCEGSDLLVGVEDIALPQRPVPLGRIVLVGDRGGAPDGPVPRRHPLQALPSPILPATTEGPRIHERWDEARKLALSFCVGFVPGDDETRPGNYDKLVRLLAVAVGEWERAADANFVHLREDDEITDPWVNQSYPDFPTFPKCRPGTSAYFGVGSAQYVDALGGIVVGAVPQLWSDPVWEPDPPHELRRALLLGMSRLVTPGDIDALSVLRHEVGHVLGFVHEEAVLGDDPACAVADPRALVPPDGASVMTTPQCTPGEENAVLSPADRLSAFLLHHTGRSRFELRAPSGYRFGPAPSGGAQILWHTPGAAEGVLWKPVQTPAGVTFEVVPFLYFDPLGKPVDGWYGDTDSEVVVPARLSGVPGRFDLVFYGPGPMVPDYAVLGGAGGTSGGLGRWHEDGFVQLVPGAFDGANLARDVVYVYAPGALPDRVLRLGPDGDLLVRSDVAQQDAFAYPVAAPFRGPGHPDDLLWWDPIEHAVILWRVDGDLEQVEVQAHAQEDLGLPQEGELVPAVGDFNGDGRADLFWYGVHGRPNVAQIPDRLWLSDSTATEIAFETFPRTAGDGFRPVVRDFDGDGVDDLLWQRSAYFTSAGPSGSETGPSYIWYFDTAGGHTAKAFMIPEGDPVPYVGDFDEDGCHDILWVDVARGAARLWRCRPAARDFDCGVEVDTPPGAAPVGVHWGV